MNAQQKKKYLLFLFAIVIFLLTAYIMVALNRPKADELITGKGSVVGRINSGLNPEKSYEMIIGDRIIPINFDGSFYIQNMSPGSYSFKIWDGIKEYSASVGNEQMIFIEPNILGSFEIESLK